ncbi:MAG: polysaccharide deacetylase family protein [Chloroflexota bacterium]|nr:polysaccharide deacetylase family protein [Chloroflexota bacterium]
MGSNSRLGRVGALALVLALLAALAPSRPASAATRSIRIPVLMYHNVGSYAGRYQVTTWGFAQQLNWLRASGYTTVSIHRVYNYMYNGGTLPRKPVVVTFDDGWAGQWNAMRELNARGMRGTFFVLGRGNGLTWYQLRQMAYRGHEIASHSMSHPWLTGLSDWQLRYEVAESKRRIEANVGVRVRYFAYPYGGVDWRVINAVAAAGYRGGIHAWGGSYWSPSKRWVEPRIEISGYDTLSQFAYKVRSATW